jgi:hypothetical protein
VDYRKNFIITLEKEWRWKARVTPREKKEDLCQEGILGTEMANLSKGSDAKLRV